MAITNITEKEVTNHLQEDAYLYAMQDKANGDPGLVRVPLATVLEAARAATITGLGTLYTLPRGRWLGDVDYDGSIGESDFLLALSSSANLSELDEESALAGDVNRDERVTSTDALQIGRIVNAEDELTVWDRANEPDVTGNYHANPNRTEEEAQFYTDIQVPGIVPTDHVTVLGAGAWSIAHIKRYEILTGAVRVYVDDLPLPSDEKDVAVIAKGEIGELRGKLDAPEHGVGLDVDFDEEEQTLYLLNGEGTRIGLGTTIVAGITGLQMRTEEDDNATQYLILSDANGVELCRTEFTVQGTGGGSAYTCRLINGMSSANLSLPSGQSCVLTYEFYEFYGQERTTVDGTAQYAVKTGSSDYRVVKTESINQGTHSISCAEFLSSGTNYFRIQVSGGESGMVKTLTFTINVVDLALTSTFSDTQAYTSSISFLYRVTGKSMSKTMHFLVDGGSYETVDIGTAHNVQLTQSINLARYGHGDHLLTCYFVTGDGTRSPELKYDIIYDTGLDTPIIGCTFDTDEVTYGETITVDYVVFTHGSDYTREVQLGVYTLDGSGEKVYHSQSTLTNVVNQQVQKWHITDYPESGTIYLEIVSGSVSKTMELTVNPISGDRDLSAVSTRLIAAYSASGRSNNATGRAALNAQYTSKDGLTTTITGSLSGFNWRSNGWVADGDGYPVLRVSGEAEVNIDLPLLATAWTDSQEQRIQLAGSPTAAGRTFEVSFRTQKVTDESREIITLWDDSTGVGLKIFPSRAYLLSDAMSVTQDTEGNILNKNAIPYVPYSSTSGKVRLTFVIEQIGCYREQDGTEKQLVRIYVNGQLAKAVAYTTDSFSTNDAKPHISADSCILDLYALRFYDYALDDAGVLRNYIADLPSITEKVSVYDKNAIVDGNDDIDFGLSVLQYPCMVLTGTLSARKGNKVKIGVQLYKPDGSVEDGYYVDWDYMETDAGGNYGNVNNVQGTSSQYYLKKNYKITFYRLENGVFKKAKVAIFPDRIPVNTICVKADYMSPDSANTGNANYWQSIATEPTPPQAQDSRVQTSIMGCPILMFHRQTEADTPVFVGRYNLNNDKGNSAAFGLENDGDEGAVTKCQKWEFLDNSEDICNFKTDELRAVRTTSGGADYPAWEDALESCYPDQGDLEDEDLSPNLDYIQMAYTWVCQRANFLAASKNSGGGTYAGETYANDYDLKLAIFHAEFTKHFNLYHTLHYFIANEVPLLVDNLSKNMFLSCYDVTAQSLVDANGDPVNVADLIAADGSVDASGIDWENSTFAVWYPTLYDLDSCLGADNNGFDQFPYYAEMWDSYNGVKIVNGSENVFWKLFYAAFYDEYVSLYRRLRDTDKSLSPELYAAAMIDNLTEALPIVAVNKDEKYKYIDAYEGGYPDGSTGNWLYTLAYLYLVKSTMESYHRDFITKRFAMLDSKCMSDAYRSDNFNLRVNRGQSNPEDLAFRVTPCQALYLYTEWGNSGSYIGGKVLEGESITMMPASSGNWADIVLAIYGASHIKSLGDLSVLYPSKLQSLSLCANLTELILGSSESGYANPYLDSVADVSYLTMLQKLNICNCTALAGTLDLSNCDLIAEVYATGSAVSSLVLPQGGYLKKLHLPATLTALNIIDHGGLQEFSAEGYDNLLRLHVENTPHIPTAAILLSRGTSLTRIRLVGVDWTLDSEALLRLIADPAMRGKAIDATGAAVEENTYPTITGTVTISRIQKSLYDTLAVLYPDLHITCETYYHVVTFVSEGQTLKTEEVADGGVATAPASPTKAATVEHVYAFRGWDATFSSVTGDLTVTAQFSDAVQQYDIEFFGAAGDAQPLAAVSGVSYGSTYSCPGTLPTKSGHIFIGWQDGTTLYEYTTLKPDSSAAINLDGTPKTIQLYAAYSAVSFPATSKSFDQLTHGEALFCAIAIQKGEAAGLTVTYYADTAEYIISDVENGISVSIALGDTRQYTLSNGETITQQVADFCHDYSDTAETKPLGITYAMKNLLTDGRAMNPSYKHCFNYRFGAEEAIVSDTLNHTSAADAALAHAHEATAAEVSAGYVDITALGPTYLQSITVQHLDGTTTTWHFGRGGFWADADMGSFSYDSSGTQTPCTFYVSDTAVDADHLVYKIGKALSSLSCPIKNWQGTVQAGWSTAQLQFATLTGQSVTLSDFGGIKINTTGTDSWNTAEKNLFDGTGISRLTYYKDWANDWNNFSEMSMGTVISIPVIQGDVVTVAAYGQSRNWGGWDRSALCTWANGDFAAMLPIGLYNTIVAAYKKSTVGNRSCVIQGGLYRCWCLSNAEVGGYTTSHPYMDEGRKYPIFTNDASRVKYRADGTGAVSGWWERSPIVANSSYFGYVYTSGYPHYNNYAHYSHGVCLGFCSGEE